jgi:hypothetical protein
MGEPMVLATSVLAHGDRASQAELMGEQDPLPPLPVQEQIETCFQICSEDCLQVARHEVAESCSPCLLVFGKREGPLDGHREKGQGTHVLDRSDFRECSFEVAKPPFALSSFSAIHTSAARVNQGTEENFCVAMLYAAASKRSSYQHAEELKLEMEEKMRHVLRMLCKMGHDVLILGAWGCGHNELSAEEVATSWQRLLRPSGAEFAGRFQKIIFAVHSDPAALKAFQKTFDGFEVAAVG